MKKSWFAVILLMAAVMMPPASRAQAAAYGEFSVGKFQNLNQDNILSGATAGLLLDGPKVLGHFQLAGDLQGRFLHKSGLDYDGLAIGPRAYFVAHHGFRPYAEFMVGFARINSVQDHLATSTYSSASTDATIQVNGGVLKRITPHFDVVGDFSYAQYYAFGGEYNPKPFSVGAVYYFTKR